MNSSLLCAWQSKLGTGDPFPHSAQFQPWSISVKENLEETGATHRNALVEKSFVMYKSTTLLTCDLSFLIEQQPFKRT